MIIALDYDETYTRDPKFWDHFVDYATFKGHKVYMVTLRHFQRGRVPKHIEEFMIVIYCNGLPKRLVTNEKGIHIDIWIDDSPATIDKGSQHTAESLGEWRRNNTD